MPVSWICLGDVSQGFEYDFGSTDGGVWLRQGCEYARLTWGSEYVSISLNIP